MVRQWKWMHFCIILIRLLGKASSENVLAYVNQTKKLTCTGPFSEPVSVYWERSTQEMPCEILFVNGERKAKQRSRITMANPTTLRIADVQLEDDGVYYCNIFSKPGYYESNFKVTVENPPMLVVENSELRLKEGENVKVDCVSSNVTSITWERYKGPPVNNLEQVNQSLILHDITTSNTGYYECRGTDIWGGTRVALFQLFVRYKPRIIMTLLRPKNQKNVAIACVSFAYPNTEKAQIFKGGRPVVSYDSRVEVRWINVSRVIVFISELESADYDTYTCSSNSTSKEQTPQLVMLPLQNNETNGIREENCQEPSGLFWNVSSKEEKLTRKVYYRHFRKIAWNEVPKPNKRNKDLSSMAGFWYNIWGLNDQQKYEAKFDVEDAYGIFSFEFPFVGENKSCPKAESPLPDKELPGFSTTFWIAVAIISGLILIGILVHVVYLYFLSLSSNDAGSTQSSDV